MKEVLKVVLGAVVILGFWSTVGFAVNFLSPNGLAVMYERPAEVDLDGTKVRLIDEKQARKSFEDGGCVFVDTRESDDYAKKHVKGAVALSPDEMFERFPLVQPLLPDSQCMVLYCYGPQCDMAEKVARFLAKQGYSQMTIMNSGFDAWEKAGFPVEGKGDRS
jgi:rhodanese-related sulfurtransferase